METAKNFENPIQPIYEVTEETVEYFKGLVMRSLGLNSETVEDLTTLLTSGQKNSIITAINLIIARGIPQEQEP